MFSFLIKWNPSHDTQSIFRIYRFGQRKNVFVYRFLSQGTMEEKIYQRQVTKQSLSQRVIDEHQLDRHFTSAELRELYSFEPETYDTQRPLPNMPEDNLFKSVLLQCRQWIVKYHEHDSLLENKIDEGLSETERRAAWEEYEREKNKEERFFSAQSQLQHSHHNSLFHLLNQSSSQSDDEQNGFLNEEMLMFLNSNKKKLKRLF